MQVFFRTSGCALGCSYCDTQGARKRTGECTRWLSGRPERIECPISAGEALSLIKGIVEREGKVHSLSITGGEPLEQPCFTAELSRLSREAGLPVYLETNGLHPEALEMTAPHADIISLDIKLPSLCGRGDLFSVYEDVIPILRDSDFFCKIVVAEGFDPAEFERGVSIAARSSRPVTLVIQPASRIARDSWNGSFISVGTEELLDCYETASRYIEDVRVIPQCHRLLDVS
jgi:organic radical activating enzyme